MINIVFCLDKNIKESLKATITSILHHTKREINFYLICPKDDNLIFEEYIKSQSLPKINLGNFEPSEEILRIIANCSYCSGSRVANYSRFFIKSIFPNLEKMIYLDTDIIVLDDIGKMWDQGEFNSEIFLAAPKYIIYHKLFYIKKLSYYFSYLNKNKYFFNGGVFMTNLKYWDNKFYQKLYRVTEDIMSNDISHVFTEILLNVMFPKFIPLDPAWNCSGYGNPKFFNFLRIRDYGFDPKILHWSGGVKPWSNQPIYKKALWKYYLEDTINGVYLLYYDDNPSNGKANIFLNSVKKLNYNLILHNVYQYEKFVKFDKSIKRNIRRHYCVKYFIEKTGKNNYYMFTDAYDIFFYNFNYKIIDYIEENNIKILYQNNGLGYRINIFSKNVYNMYTKQFFDSSFGINGGAFIGKGFNILNYYNKTLKYVTKNDYSDEELIIRNLNLNEYVTIDTKYFFNIDAIHKSLKFLKPYFKTSHNLDSYTELNDINMQLKFNPEILLFHYCGSHKEQFIQLGNYLKKNKKIENMKNIYPRYYILKLHYYLFPFLIFIAKTFIILIFKLKQLFYQIYKFVTYL